MNWSNATRGFIPIEVLGEPVHLGRPRWRAVSVRWRVRPACGGTNLTANGGTLTNPGVQIYTDGILSTLIATGTSVTEKQIRCSDLTDAAVVHDSDPVQPYFVIDTNSVVLAIGNTQLSLTCQLNIDAGDGAGSLSVQWAKI